MSETAADRVATRAQELEVLVKAAEQAVDAARRAYAYAMELSHDLERKMMEADLAREPVHSLFCRWLDQQKQKRRKREILREAAAVLAGRTRAWTLFAGAACELAGENRPKMEAHLL